MPFHLIPGKENNLKPASQIKIWKAFEKHFNPNSLYVVIIPLFQKKEKNMQIEIDVQTCRLQKIREISEQILPLESARNRELNSKRLKSLREDALPKENIEINEENLFSCFKDFDLLCQTPNPQPLDLDKIERLYDAFCQYTAIRPFINMTTIKRLATETLRERSCYFFRIGTKDFPICKIDLLSLNSSYFKQLLIGNFSRAAATQKDPFPLPEISEDTFQEVARFIENPKDYRLLNLEGEALKNLLIELVEKAQFFDLSKLRKMCEKGLEPFVVKENAKGTYEFANGGGYPLLQKIALDRLAKMGLAPSSEPNEFCIREKFFDDRGSFPEIKVDSLKLGELEDISANQLEELAKHFPEVEKIVLPVNQSVCKIKPENLAYFSHLKSIVFDFTFINKPRDRDRFEEAIFSVLENENFRKTFVDKNAYKISFETFENIPYEVGDRLHLIKRIARLFPDNFEVFRWSLDLSPVVLNEFLCLMPRLKSLDISCESRNSTYNYFATLKLLTLCPHLTALNFLGRLEEENALLEIAQGCKQIEAM